jgi:DnaJ-class molecular chaperone
METCIVCNGDGEIAVPNFRNDVPRNDRYDVERCPECKGRGETETQDNKREQEAA